MDAETQTQIEKATAAAVAPMRAELRDVTAKLDAVMERIGAERLVRSKSELAAEQRVEDARCLASVDRQYG